MAQRNTDHHQTYPFGALSDWNMTLISFLCVSVCSSTVCWSGQLQRPQRPPGPRSFSGTQWVDNRRQSARFFGPRVNSPTDIFTLSSIKSCEVNLIYICVCIYISSLKSQIKKCPQSLFMMNQPVSFDSLSVVQGGETRQQCFQEFSCSVQ